MAILNTRRSQVLGYAVAVSSVAAAALLEYLLSSAFQQNPSLLFFAAIILTSWHSGLLPGLFSVLLSAVIINLIFRDNIFLPVASFTDGVRLAIFLLASIMVSWLTARRKLAEARLLESEERFRQLAENIREVFWMSDPRAPRMLYISPAYEEIWGRSCQSLYEQPRSFLESIHPDDCERVAESLIRQSQGKRTDEEYRVVRPDGSIRWIRDRGFPIRDEAGQVYRVTGIAEEITARKQFEQELQQANERFQLAAAAINSVIYEWNLETNHIERTSGLFDLLGFRVDEAEPSSQWWQARIHPDDFERAAAAFSAAIEAGNSATCEYRLRNKNDEYIYVWDKMIIVRDEQGRARRIVGSTQDITERKRAEEALRISEEQFSKAFRASPDVLIISRQSDGLIFEVNDTWKKMFGYSREEGVGKSGLELNLYVDSEDRRRALAQLEADGFLRDFEIEVRHKLGATRLISLAVEKMIINGENCLLSILHDITEQKMAEAERADLLAKEQQARRQAEHTADRIARLQAVTAALSGALTLSEVAEVIVDQGVAALGAFAGSMALLTDDGKMVELVRAIGYPHREVKAWKRFSIDASAPLADAIKSGQPIFFESLEARSARYPHLSEDQKIIGGEAAAAIPLIVGGATIGAVGLSFIEPRSFSAEDRAFMQALSQQCAQALERAGLYEKEQELRKEAEVANRAKDEFLATVSHELRTPLNAILGWAGMLRSGKLDEANQAHAVEVIERNARSQAQIVEDILDVSRIISGKLRLNIRPTDLESVIKAATDAVRPAAQAKSIQLLTSIEDRFETVMGDPDRLQQVVWNLLSNAVKFTPDNGRVEIRAQRANSSVHIIVSDSGQGISPDFLPRVFDRFLQADGSFTRRHGGLGLGLALARHVVEMHGGTVQAYSAGTGRGATFTVTIPLKASDLAQVEQASSRAAIAAGDSGDLTYRDYSSLSGLRVLVVDDDADTREMITTMLAQYGIKVFTSASAVEALESLSLHNPDLLISDIAMPEEDGYALISKIRALGSARGKVPAVALTAHVRIEDRMRTLLAGFQMFVPKPIEPYELLEAIMAVAEQRDRD